MDEGVPARAAQTYAVLAMTEYKSGGTNAAGKSLAEGIKIAETKLRGGDRIDWSDELIARLLLREAAELITGKPVAEKGQ